MAHPHAGSEDRGGPNRRESLRAPEDAEATKAIIETIIRADDESVTRRKVATCSEATFLIDHFSSAAMRTQDFLRFLAGDGYVDAMGHLQFILPKTCKNKEALLALLAGLATLYMKDPPCDKAYAVKIVILRPPMRRFGAGYR